MAHSLTTKKKKKTGGCKWVITVKCNVDGSVERNKTRLVAKGFTQAYGELIMKKHFLQLLKSINIFSGR